MKSAFLILCHKNPEQVEMLINALRDTNADFYIHIDKKTASFELDNKSHVYFVPDALRVDIRWATMSMVEATLHTMQYMLSREETYDYVVLLSGQDFPIKSKDYIREYFEKNKGANFIELLPYDSATFLRYNKRSEIYYPKFMQKRTVFSKTIRKIYLYITGGRYNTFSLFRRADSAGISFEYGSQWWGLTYECVVWMMAYLLKNTEYEAFFRHSMTPDECFFQTLFAMSPYRQTQRGSLTFLIWDKNNNNPRLFTEEDYEILLNKEALFARKFDSKIDEKIMLKLLNWQRGV